MTPTVINLHEPFDWSDHVLINMPPEVKEHVPELGKDCPAGAAWAMSSVRSWNMFDVKKMIQEADNRLAEMRR